MRTGKRRTDTRPKPERWHSYFKSAVPAIEHKAIAAVVLVDRYAKTGRQVPRQLYLSRRFVLAELIAEHHHHGATVIRAACKAIDSLDHNQTTTAAPVINCGHCGETEHKGSCSTALRKAER